MKTRLLLPAMGALCCCFSAAAQADLKWTEVMTFEGGNAPQMPQGMEGGMAITTNKWAKKDAMRSETSFKVGPMQMGNAEISHCDTKERFLIDADLKMYALGAPEVAGTLAMPGMPGMGEERPPAGKPKKGTSIMEFNIQDLGKEMVAGIETRHYSIAMKSTLTGCAGNGIQETKMETWVSSIRMPSVCQQVDYKIGVGAAIRMSPSCDVTPEFKGDMTAMKNAFDGLVMRTKVSSKDVSFTREVTMLSQAELDDAPFTIPDDWKKVTEKELQGAQQRAMMKKLMDGMKMGGGDN